MLFNVRHLHIGVKSGHTVVEGLRVVLELSTQITHPVDVEFAASDVEGSWLVPLAEGLALDELVNDAIHGDLSLESLIACPDTLHQIMAQTLLIMTIAESLLNSSLILKGTTC